MSTYEKILILTIIILLIILVVVFSLMLNYKKKSNVNKIVTNKETKEENIASQTFENKEKQTFNPDLLDISSIQTTEKLISLNEFITLINNNVDKKSYKSISTATITAWLKKKNYIKQEKMIISKEVTFYSVTQEGCGIGIVSHAKNSDSIPTYLLNKQAQDFILKSLTEIYSKKTDEKKVNIPDNAGARWTQEEETQLIDEFINKKLPISEIARIHKRKTGGISSKLVHLGLLDRKFIPYRWGKK